MEFEKAEIDKFKTIISKFVKKDKINHAYLIETNFENKIILAKELIKWIIQLDGDAKIEDLEKNSDLIIINSDTNSIKVEEIENLKEKFITKSTIGNKRFYIINDAEKMNDYASNKLLKFIEEPEGEIVAILLTSNKNNLLKTITSRCQIIRYFSYINKFKELGQEYICSLFDFVLNIEENKEKAIAFQNKIDIKKMSDRVYLQEFLNNLLYIYDDAINYKIEKKITYFINNRKEIEFICNNNDINSIRIKINAIYEIINRLKYNPNIKLLIDKLIILMTGVE